jgi:hypothetical protein
MLLNTRQMLDELDTLMERMLALPVNELDEPAAGKGPPVRALAARLTLLEQPERAAPVVEPSRADAAAPRPQPWREALTTATTESAEPRRAEAQPRRVQAAPRRAGELPLAFDPVRLLSTGLPTPPPGLDAGPATPPPALSADLAVSLRQVDMVQEVPLPPPAPWLKWLLPLWWVNAAFDGCTRLLGPCGAWLRHSGGRTMLGATGIAMLLLALLLLLQDWLGWTW